MKGKLVYDIVNLLLYGSAFIGLCASSVTALTLELTDSVEQHFQYIVLVGVATAALYSAHRVIGLQKLKHVTANERYAVIRKYSIHIWLYCIGWILISAWIFLSMFSWTFLLWLIPGGFIALAYVIPFMAKQRRLRDVGWIKIILIGWSWAWLTAFLPLYYFDKWPLYISVIASLERMLFIVAITIPFEIRDMRIDRSVGLHNMPLKFGLSRTIKWGYALCIVVVLLSGVLALHVSSPAYFISMLIVCLFTTWIIKESYAVKDDYFFSGLTDGTMILAIVIYHFLK